MHRTDAVAIRTPARDGTHSRPATVGPPADGRRALPVVPPGQFLGWDLLHGEGSQPPNQRPAKARAEVQGQAPLSGRGRRQIWPKAAPLS